jgi:uncharacterized membrane protein
MLSCFIIVTCRSLANNHLSGDVSILANFTGLLSLYVSYVVLYYIDIVIIWILVYIRRLTAVLQRRFEQHVRRNCAEDDWY